MKPVFRKETRKIAIGELGKESSLPDLLCGENIQNKGSYQLDEDDEIYEGYGKLNNIYPYRKYVSYQREVKEKDIPVYILENDFLKATFLAGYGGRLWELIDKMTGKNLIYTNDVIRASNLAVRNAWFSGGVEWNIGVIGHTPLTMENLFAAVLEDDDKNTVLRMYEYERIRKVTYQMDFWLEEDSPFLKCRMRIVNHNEEVVPMYWWSNIAVPEYVGGRVLVPAKEAYTSSRSHVYKVKIPMVDNVDVSRYEDIPSQVDYFFHIKQDKRKYIVNLDKEGYGLIHFSTSRLQSRKMFCWGYNRGAKRWQEFLTNQAGNYVEIQAGLAKTQYGCIPMAPHTAWEWIEEYGAVQTEKELLDLPFEDAQEKMSEVVEKIFLKEDPEKKLTERKKIALTQANVIQRGSAYGQLENLCCKKIGERGLPSHLNFDSKDIRLSEWENLLEKGCFPEKDVADIPGDFMADSFWYKEVKKSTQSVGCMNWYTWYHLGIMQLHMQKNKKAEKSLKKSLELKENAWACHGLAICSLRRENRKKAAEYMIRGLSMRMDDLSYAKTTMELLILTQSWKEIKDLYYILPETVKGDKRIQFSFIYALAFSGKEEEAYSRLTEKDFELPDIREGSQEIALLWEKIAKKLFPENNYSLPEGLDFNSIL